MRHPFAGSVVTSEEQPVYEMTRRGALGRMVFSTAGVLGITGVAAAQQKIKIQIGAPVQATTLAIGEEGGKRKLAAATTEPFGEEAGKVTSFYVPGLEDGGATRVPPRRGPVTEAVNEQGIAPGRRPIQLTNALNENGVAPPKALPPQKVTEALKEQGGVQKGVPIQAQQIQVQVQPAVPPQATTKALNEEGARVSTRALGEEGGGRPGVNRIVKVEPATRDLKPAQLEAAWKDLSDKEPAKALQACAILYGAKQGVAFLKGKLKSSAKAADPKQVAALISKLDDESFHVREKAASDLEDLGIAALPALQAAAEKPASAEAAARIRRLLDKSKDMPIFLQLQRGVEVLVALQSAEAKQVVETLSKEEPPTLVTPIASLALARMK